MEKAAYALIGAIVGGTIAGAITLFKTFLDNRANIRIEKLKIHDGNVIEAYKRLFVFAQRLSNETFPLAEYKYNNFRMRMANSFELMECDRIYFSKELNDILEEFSNAFVCMTSPDLIQETEEYVKEFIENKLFDNANIIKTLIQKETNKLIS